MGEGSKFIKEQRGSRNALFTRTLFMNGPMGGQQMSYKGKGVEPHEFYSGHSGQARGTPLACP